MTLTYRQQLDRPRPGWYNRVHVDQVLIDQAVAGRMPAGARPNLVERDLIIRGCVARGLSDGAIGHRLGTAAANVGHRRRTLGLPAGTHVAGYRSPAPPRPAPQIDQQTHLTAREAEVLRLVAVGATTNQIAAALQISYQTARAHLAHIARRWGTRNRWASLYHALQAGLL